MVGECKFTSRSDGYEHPQETLLSQPMYSSKDYVVSVPTTHF